MKLTNDFYEFCVPREVCVSRLAGCEKCFFRRERDLSISSYSWRWGLENVLEMLEVSWAFMGSIQVPVDDFLK
jgi:hypothetical protein